MLSYTLHAHDGFTHAVVALPRCGNARSGAVSSSFSAEVVWGDRHCPSFIVPHPEFHIMGKEIL
jgi:hypothetical protein